MIHFRNLEYRSLPVCFSAFIYLMVISSKAELKIIIAAILWLESYILLKTVAFLAPPEPPCLGYRAEWHLGYHVSWTIAAAFMFIL